jgi:NCAIR mutase (PurE)-related protein
MNERELEKLLEGVQSGAVSLESAVEKLKVAPYEEVGEAVLDVHRALRRGIGEVVFGLNKSAEQLRRILSRFNELAEKNVLVTRLSKEKYAVLSAAFPENLRYDAEGEIAVLNPEDSEGIGHVAVITAGASDLRVAREAVVTARTFGSHVNLITDVGVAGLHRLTSRLSEIRSANVLIVIAGMEGALPSVVGGFTDKPILAVPTSAGSGASFGGLAALLAMLNSCASGVSVVNIDNGFGAAYVASMINRMSGKEE